MINRIEIKAQARETLRSQYGLTLAIYLIPTLLLGALSAMSFGIAGIILAGPITIAMVWGLLCVYRNVPVSLSDCFTRSFDNVGRKIGGYLWMGLWIFIWSLVFWIPGIVKAFSYAMTPYILADMPDLPAKDALKLSMRMMDGHKMDLFVFCLSFLGWMLLSSLTFGILALLYVGPYMATAEAGFYAEVKQDAIRRGILVPAQTV